MFSKKRRVVPVEEKQENLANIIVSESTKILMEGLKNDFLNYLGAQNEEELYKNLFQSFAGDNFESNTKAVFLNYFYDKHTKGVKDSNNFHSSFLQWGKERVDEAFKVRWKVTAGSVVGLFTALGVSFANPLAGVAIGAGVGLVSGTAEGVAKRNITSFGHLEDHLAEKIYACIERMLQNSNNNLSAEGCRRLEELTKPKGKVYKSTAARIASYFSGAVVGSVKNLNSLYPFLSPLTVGVIGTVIPFLPLMTTAFSRKASNLRHESALNKEEYFTEAMNIFFDPTSWKNSDDTYNLCKEISTLTKEFSKNFANCDNHGRLPGEEKFTKYAQGEKENCNPKKLVALPSWLGARIHKIVKRHVLKGKVRDLAEAPQDKKVDDLLNSIQIIPDKVKFNEDKKEESKINFSVPEKQISDDKQPFKRESCDIKILLPKSSTFIAGILSSSRLKPINSLASRAEGIIISRL